MVKLLFVSLTLLAAASLIHGAATGTAAKASSAQSRQMMNVGDVIDHPLVKPAVQLVQDLSGRATTFTNSFISTMDGIRDSWKDAFIKLGDALTKGFIGTANNSVKSLQHNIKGFLGTVSGGQTAVNDILEKENVGIVASMNLNTMNAMLSGLKSGLKALDTIVDSFVNSGDGLKL